MQLLLIVLVLIDTPMVMQLPTMGALASHQYRQGFQPNIGLLAAIIRYSFSLGVQHWAASRQSRQAAHPLARYLGVHMELGLMAFSQEAPIQASLIFHRVRMWPLVRAPLHLPCR